MTGKNDARGGRKRGPQASPRRDLSIGGADSETTAASERETAPQTQFKCPQSDGLLGATQYVLELEAEGAGLLKPMAPMSER
jgi:hypothetical protein